MGFNRAQLFAAFTLGLLIMSDSAEAGHIQQCGAWSHLFHGPCKSSRRCAETCHQEHFTRGHCSRKGVVGDQINGVGYKYCKCTGSCAPPPPSEVPEPPPQPNVMKARKMYY
ncbi:hypothetical protein CFC21_043807 [Triticum aestivum]|uniref:Knottins-like domain-containing protein n=2 Tax=Triticum aestivum TaxID=4565 RepID=A0A3B6FVY6_WHEAT|nr:hypothetical protein CFC21_043807 [Triticum aestivum]